MKIEIKSRWDSKKILFSVEADNIKIALQMGIKSGADLRSADLSGADLSGAYLSGAYLRSADLSGAYLSGADLRSAYLSSADLSGAYLSGADLRSADLSGAYLSGAYLSGADLSSAYLSGAKEYSESHFIFFEIVRRQKVDSFTNGEWQIIGQLSIHLLCWDSIKKRFGKKIIPIFKKLAKLGFDEYLEKYKEVIKK